MTYATALAVGPREENQSVGRKLIALVTVTTVGPRNRISQPVRGVGYEPGVSVTPEPMRDAMTTRGNESAMLRPASTAILATSRPLWHTGTI